MLGKKCGILALLLALLFAAPVWAGVFGDIFKPVGNALLGVFVDNLLPILLTLGLGMLGGIAALIITTMKNVANLLNAIVDAAADNKFSGDEVKQIRARFWDVVLPWRKTPATVGPLIMEPPPYE